jgi:hypothetical protein
MMILKGLMRSHLNVDLLCRLIAHDKALLRDSIKNPCLWMEVRKTILVLKIILREIQLKDNLSQNVLRLCLNLISYNQNHQMESTVKIKKTTTTTLKSKPKKLNRQRLSS